MQLHLRKVCICFVDKKKGKKKNVMGKKYNILQIDLLMQNEQFFY